MPVTLPSNVELSGQTLPLAVRWSNRARRMTVTVDHTLRQVRLVLPAKVSLDEGLHFCRKHADWIADRLATLPPPVPFRDGNTLPIAGDDLTIRHKEAARRSVLRDGEHLVVGGPEDYLPRRVKEFCRDEALQRISSIVADKSDVIKRQPRNVKLRESRTRWGSCSPNGDLSFCWRLIFAPHEVIEYVVAHEVAHLVHMNHGPNFWSLVGKLTHEVPSSRRWLSRHGATLWRYGVEPEG